MNLKEEFEQYKKESIRWMVGDFYDQAAQNEFNIDPNFEYEDDNSFRKYDPTKFQAALELMIHRHDAMYGITWDTIDYYLNELCLKEK